MLMQAFLVGRVSFVAACDGGYGSLYVARPIVLSPIIGLILGDLQSGLAIGATLELLFMGSISVGAYVPPDTNVGSVLATAFAISLGQGTDAAVALAMPIAVLALGIYNLLAAVMPFFLQFADKAAEEGNDRMLLFWHWWMGFPKAIMRGLIVGICFYLGAEQVQGLLNVIPQFVFDGMGAAAGILPAMGFAMLMRMIVNKRLIPFFVLGFALAAYLSLPVLGVAIIAVVIAVEKTGFVDGNESASVAVEGSGDDDDF